MSNDEGARREEKANGKMEHQISSPAHERQNCPGLRKHRVAPSRTQSPATSTHTETMRTYALHENVVPKTEKPLSHLLLRNINDTDPDVRAPLSDHSHRWSSHITGAHTADVVLELLGSHGVSCGKDGGGKGFLTFSLPCRCVKGTNGARLGTRLMWNNPRTSPHSLPFVHRKLTQCARCLPYLCVYRREWVILLCSCLAGGPGAGWGYGGEKKGVL